MGYRLKPDMQSDLEWYWCQCDADLGVCSTGNIEHRAPKEVEQTEGVVVRDRRGWRKLSPEVRADVRWSKQDEEIRLMWRELKCKGDTHVVSIEDPVWPDGMLDEDGLRRDGLPRTPMPTWARRVISNDRRRAVTIHAAITRMVKTDGGPRHERVLYRVYGPATRHPVCYGRIGSELAPIVEYTDAVSRFMTAGVTRTEAGEKVLGKGTSDRQVAEVRVQANRLLEEASRAYAEAAEANDAERGRERKRRIPVILGAA